MTELVSKFLETYNYPRESFEQILSVSLCVEDSADFNYLIDSFYADSELGPETIKTSLEEISKAYHVNICTLNLLFYIYLSEQLKEQYKKEGDDVIFIHIPSSGEPFDKQSRLNSYERAYMFYHICFTKSVLRIKQTQNKKRQNPAMQ